MKAIILLGLSLLLIAAACNSPKKVTEQATNKAATSKDKLHGNWTMVSYSAFRPQKPELNAGDIIWKIDSQKNSLSVLKKNPELHTFMGPDTGAYIYTKEGKMLTVDHVSYFYSITDGKLRLDSNTDPRLSKDLPVIYFERH